MAERAGVSVYEVRNAMNDLAEACGGQVKYIPSDRFDIDKGDIYKLYLTGIEHTGHGVTLKNKGSRKICLQEFMRPGNGRQLDWELEIIDEHTSPEGKKFSANFWVTWPLQESEERALPVCGEIGMRGHDATDGYIVFEDIYQNYPVHEVQELPALLRELASMTYDREIA